MQTNNNKMRYVGAPCGSGKTYAVCHTISEANKAGTLNNTLMISPSKELVRQTQAQLQQFGVGVEVITTETTTNVSATAVELFRDNDLKGKVVLMTHQGFQRTPVFLNKQYWDLIVDEIPAVDAFYSPTIPYNHQLLTDYLDVIPMNGIVNEVVIREGMTQAVDKFLRQSSDDVYNIVKPILRDLTEGRKVYTDTKAYGKIVDMQDISKDTPDDVLYGNAKNKLYFLSLLTPAIFEGWDDITLLGANFEHSMLARFWHEHHGIDFILAEDIYDRLRYQEHDIGHRLAIRYLQDDPWSKYQRDMAPNADINFKTYGHAIDDYVENVALKGEQYIYVANNDYDNKHLKNAERMPVISHGLNTYQKHTNVYYSPAINRQPKHMQMLDAIGFDNTFVQRATAHEVVYQAIMRCALRNPEDDQKVNVIVPDKASGEALVRLFPGCSIGDIGDNELKQTRPLAKPVGERKRRSQFNKQIDELKLTKRVRFSYIDEDCTAFINMDMSPNDGTDAGNSSNVLMSFFPNIHTSQGTTLDISDLISHRRSLKKLFTSNVYGNGDNIPGATGKHDNFLCSPALFDPDKTTDTDRGLDNVEYTAFLALDFDNGDLTPEDFIRFFWDDAQRGEKLAFDIMNSAGHDPDNGINKFRVFMYYSTTATVEEHYAVFDTIKARIAKAGYPTFKDDNDKQAWLKERGIKHVKESGLDMSKRPPSSLFYLPGKLKGKENVAFFKAYGNDANRPGLLIDPVTYHRLRKQKTQLTPIEYEVPKTEHKTVDDNAVNRQQRIDKAIQQYRSIPVGGHQRNKGLFSLALTLQNIGLTTFDIEGHLRTVANGERKILDRISGVLKSIQSPKYRKTG